MTTARSRSPSEGPDSGEDDQAKLLELLNAQCAASLGGILPVASTSRLEDSDNSNSDEGYSNDENDDEEDEWTGIGNDDDRASSSANSKQAVVVAFEDSTRYGKRKFDESGVATFGQKDGFMVCISL